MQKVVQYNAEKIAAEKTKSEKMLTDLNEMLYNANMMSNLLRDLLDLAQLENNSFKIVNTNFNLREVVDEAFAMVRHLANLKDIELICDAGPTESDQLKYIYGDRRRFIQILVNFLSNALKFSYRKKKVTVRLVVNEFVEKKVERIQYKRQKTKTNLVDGTNGDDTHYTNFSIIVSD